MHKQRFSEQQIIGFIKEHEAGGEGGGALPAARDLNYPGFLGGWLV